MARTESWREDHASGVEVTVFGYGYKYKGHGIPHTWEMLNNQDWAEEIEYWQQRGAGALADNCRCVADVTCPSPDKEKTAPTLKAKNAELHRDANVYRVALNTLADEIKDDGIADRDHLLRLIAIALGEDKEIQDEEASE